jgi:hypothetical protein
MLLFKKQDSLFFFLKVNSIGKKDYDKDYK